MDSYLVAGVLENRLFRLFVNPPPYLKKKILDPRTFDPPPPIKEVPSPQWAGMITDFLLVIFTLSNYQVEDSCPSLSKRTIKSHFCSSVLYVIWEMFRICFWDLLRNASNEFCGEHVFVSDWLPMPCSSKHCLAQIDTLCNFHVSNRHFLWVLGGEYSNTIR